MKIAIAGQELERITPGVYFLNYTPGTYPDVLMPDVDGFTLLTPDGEVPDIDENDRVTRVYPWETYQVKP